MEGSTNVVRAAGSGHQLMTATGQRWD